MPGLSVIIPNFNHAAFLPRAIESSLRATAGHVEIIVVDDASTDDSVTVVNEWTTRHGNVRLLRHEKNLGVEHALNRGLREATQEFVLFRAADDVTLPGFVDEAMRRLAQFSAAPFCLGDTRFFGDDVNRGRSQPAGLPKEATFIAADRWNEDFGGNELSVCAAIIRRAVVDRLGGFDPELRWVSDWVVLAELGLRSGFVYLPQPACAMHMSAASYNSSGTRDDERQRAIFARLLGRWAEFEEPAFAALRTAGILDFFATALRRLAPSLRPVLAPRALELLAVIDQPPPPGRRGCGMRAVLRGFLHDHAPTLGRLRAVALFGAGGHTELLLQVWRETSLPPPVAILVSAEQGVTRFCNLPVMVTTAAAAADFDAIVISSKSYEPDLGRMARARFPTLPVFRIWT